MTKLFPAVLLLIFTACQGNYEPNTKSVREEPASSPTKIKKVVSLCNTASETLFSLGLEDRIVGVDITSKYPESFGELPQLGHYPNFNSEAIISLAPDIVFARAGEVKPELEVQLKALDIDLVLINQVYSIEGTNNIIDLISNKVELTNKGQDLKERIRSSFSLLTPLSRAPKTIFIYARAGGPLLVSGNNTQMDGLMQLAGGQNAITEFDGFKPLSSEGLINANPEVIIVFQSALSSLNGLEGLNNTPGMEATTAGQKKNFYAIDEVLAASFGPRLGEAIQDLHHYYESILVE